MHSTVANATQTPSHTARNQSARSAFSNTALRKANRELADVLGGKSMILVCISNPSKNCFHRQYTVLRGKVAKERSQESGVRIQEGVRPSRQHPEIVFGTLKDLLGP
jgi:hypothetical protein